MFLVSQKAAYLTIELLKLYINGIKLSIVLELLEAFERTVNLAEESSRRDVNLEDFESILFQLTLDFAS